MSQAQLGTKNSMFGKFHTEQSKSLMNLVKKGKVHDNKTKEAISVANGTAVYLYAACLGNSTDSFCLIQKFSSIREAGKYSYFLITKNLFFGRAIFYCLCSDF
uniref:GIY-YIG endonuclease family protein n=1 Tax=Rhizoctonia solani TaxID=456999 RepID=N0ACQ8_9AGAM|nr:GIY-YIG endonuclease family protein [Rhizoctonia solani]AGK45367.1 GIY-YIG endonuclease family protein [Rhizoctonia solani]